MSIFCDCSQSESDSGYDYDCNDFDLELLDDVQMMGEIVELHNRYDRSSKECSQSGRRISNRKDSSKKTHKHSSSKARKHSFSKAQIKTKTPLIQEEVVPSLSYVDTPYVPSSTTVTSPLITALFGDATKTNWAATARSPVSLSDPIFSFPTAVINFLNCGDNVGLAELFRTNMSEQCALGIYCLNSILSPKVFLRFFELMNEIHPDRIFSIKNASTTNNHITVSTQMKFTDCKMLHGCVAQPLDDPVLMTLFSTRANQLKRRIRIPDQTEAERQQIVQLAESDWDLCVEASIQFHVIFSEDPRKVTGLYLTGGLTTAYPAPANLMKD